VLADLARGLLGKKIPALQEALEGRFGAEHSLIVSQILAHIDFLDESIDRLSAEIEQRIAPFAAQRDLLMSIPGVRQRTAEVLISEIGDDMSIFATPKHLASWAKMSPGNDESAGKRRSGKTGKANKWLSATLTEAALAAGRTKHSYLAAQYQRLRGRRGHNRGVTAVGHSILTAIWHMLQNRSALQRPRQRLLHPPEPRPPHQTPRLTARSPRPQRHPRSSTDTHLTGDFATAATTRGGPSASASRPSTGRRQLRSG